MVQFKFWFHLKISQDHRVVSYRCRMFLGHWVTDLDKADLDLTRRKTEIEIFLENSSTHTALIWTLCFTWLHKRYWKLPGKWKTSCWRKRAPLKQRKHSWMPLDLREMYVWNLTQRRLKSAKGEYPQDNVVSEVGMLAWFQCFHVFYFFCQIGHPIPFWFR